MYFIDSRPEGRMLLQFQPALLACAIALTACSPEANQDQRDVTQSTASQIAITAPWSRETAVGQDAGGAFMAITNSGAAPDRLTGGSTPVATEVQTLRLQSDTGFILDLARQCAASGKRNPTETMGATGEYRGSIGSRPFAHGPFESGLLELAMPLRHTRHACFATEAVVANYG